MQIKYIRQGIRDGLTLEQLKYLANPDFNNPQMKSVEEGLANGLSMDEIKLFIDNKFNIAQCEELLKIILEDKLNPDEIDLIADSCFNQFKMEELADGFNNGLSLEEVDLYADPKFTANQMNEIKRALLTQNKDTIDKVKEKYDLVSVGAKIKRLVKC
jgi:hypothetical protein